MQGQVKLRQHPASLPPDNIELRYRLVSQDEQLTVDEPVAHPQSMTGMDYVTTSAQNTTKIQHKTQGSERLSIYWVNANVFNNYAYMLQ